MEKFSNLSTPVKGGVVVGGAGGLLGAGLLMGTGQWVFLAILLIFLALAVGAYFLWRAWKRKKQAARMSGELQQHSSASPRAISDPGARARLDDLRKKFEQGVQEYRSRGKDLYTLPWYVIVGEPGSGKTEAIRHSNVGFPPGMQDEFQGVGGTINMNWWFTNHSVLLDTAGRLMFEEVKPGEQSEWKEFLNLLKKNRPNCPINGLFLVIPSDSLIKDSADDIARKAGKIAQQLDVIQRVLDVRFPVYVVVTKCDKVNGFREFFDGLTDPQLQHQMMGWSNPDQLDTPFRPDLVDQHLEKVVSRLRRRRMGALRDPMPENQSGRRADEVDSLFALPHSLRLLAPRLRRYLETIFVAGEWSAKPLFLRGIYFTSSMREGAALDEELAKAIGVGVEELGEEKVWERERAYFLRDLFLEKVFREKGLVTRATNTTRMLRGRQLALYGAGSAALVLFVLLAWFAMGDIKRSVAQQSGIWTTVSKAGWTGPQSKIWKQSIVPFENGSYASRVVTNGFGERGQLTIGEYHARLQEQATKPQRRAFVTILFPRMYHSFEARSRRAQRIVFENGVVKPLVDASRQQIEVSKDPEAQKRLPDALAALIELEEDILARQRESGRALTEANAERFLSRLMSFVSKEDVKADAKLVATMAKTYTSDEDQSWPSPWLSGQTAGTQNLAGNHCISQGLTRLQEIAESTFSKSTQDWSHVTALRTGLEQFQAAESDLLSIASGTRPDAGPQFVASLQKLALVYTNIEQQLQSESIVRLSKSGFLLSNAFNSVQLEASNSSAGALAKVMQAYENALKQQGKQTNRFTADLGVKLIDLRKHLRSRGEELFRTDRPELISRLDTALVVGNSFRSRWESYGRALDAATSEHFKRDLIGLKGQPLNERLTNSIAGRQVTERYQGPFEKEFKQTMRFAWDLADSMQRQKFLTAYVDSAVTKLKPRLRFPICDSADGATLDLKSAEQLLRDLELITKDLKSESLLAVQAKENPSWQTFTNRVFAYFGIAGVLLNDSYKPRNCLINLAQPLENKPRDRWRDQWRRLSLLADGEEVRRINTPYPNPEEPAAVRVDQRVSFVLATQQGELKKDLPLSRSWGALALLFDRTGSPPKRINKKQWEVELKREGVDGAIPLIIDFPDELPDLTDWPKPF